MITAERIEEAAYGIMFRAGIEIPEDYETGLRGLAKSEEGDLSAFVIEAMLENYDAAREDGRAMCADTGLPRYFVKVGNEARIEGGFIELEIGRAHV